MENIYTLYEHYEPSQRILFGRYMAQMNPFDYKIIWLPFTVSVKAAIYKHL